MPRPRRIEVEGGVYHLYNRFVSGSSFFKDPNVVKIFKKIFYSTAEEFGITVISWLCMPNHFHSIIQIPGSVLSLFLQKYSTNFARYVNILYNRKGHVFQGRHRTQIVDTERYLITLIAYIYYNPVRAGITNNIYAYKWSNLLEVVSNNTNKDYDLIYHQFHKDRERGRLIFKNWIENIYDEMYGENRKYKKGGQFITDSKLRKKILENIERRLAELPVSNERRKSNIIAKKYEVEEIKQMINTLKVYQEDWEGLWRSEGKFILHFKWYLLRNYCKLSLVKISILEKQIRHTTISESLRAIKNNKNKQNAIMNIISKLMI